MGHTFYSGLYTAGEKSEISMIPHCFQENREQHMYNILISKVLRYSQKELQQKA